MPWGALHPHPPAAVPLGRLDLPGPAPPLWGLYKGGGGRRQDTGCGCPPPFHPLYRPPMGGDGLGRCNLPRGRRPGGWSAPQGKWCAPHPRVSNPRRRGAQGGRTSPLGDGSPPTSAHGALRDRWPHPVDPRDPFGGPGTIPGDPETFPMAETALPIYNSLPPDHSGTPRDIQDLIRDSEQLSVCCILIFIQP